MVLESTVSLRRDVRSHKRMMKVVLEMEVSPGEHDASGKKELRGRWEESKSRVGGVMKSFFSYTDLSHFKIHLLLLSQVYVALPFFC